MSKFIDLSNLEFGDIILTSGKGIKSFIIRSLTRSQYSHAAIYVGFGLIVEATKMKGISTRPLEIVKVESTGINSPSKEIAYIPETQKSHVFRHKDMVHNKDFSSYEQRQSIRNHLGDRYSHPLHLLNTSNNLRNKLTNPIIDRILNNLEKNKKLTDRYFCSQFIANVLEEMGYALEKENSHAYLPTPESISKSNSIIRKEDAEVTALNKERENIEKDRKDLLYWQKIFLNHYLLSEKNRENEKTDDELGRRINDYNDELKNSLLKK